MKREVNPANGILLPGARQAEAVRHWENLKLHVIDCLRAVGHPQESPLTVKLAPGIVLHYDPDALKDHMLAHGGLRPVPAEDLADLEGKNAR